MSRHTIYFLSAAIFLAYGLLADTPRKSIFIILGIAFAIIGCSFYLRTRNTKKK